MALQVCMNILCGTTTSPVWKKGWIMRSGQIAVLCDKCGFAYEQNIFCGTFHADDSGWRECKTCGKPLHCGCIASEALVEILDFGGVKCTSCARNSGPYSGKTDENPERHVAVTVDGGIKNYGNYEVGDGPKRGSIPRNNDTNVSLGQPKHEVDLSSHGVGTICSSNTEFSSVGLPKESRLDISSANLAAKGICGLVQPNLGISLGGLTANRQSFVGMAFQEKEQFSLCAPFRPGSVMPEPQTLSLTSHCDTNLSMVPPVRVARPPVEGRGRNQLLPRYWPRITDQELQQMSGDSNCTIVPLFEKVLSASDAGRIGRLVLPKACAEEYFPPISQPEGLPLKIQDVKGKEWVFQFRFWPNNNSRMYVLEGVTPCIQSMQLQAGDTVIFSRMDPVGKLVMGCRKASAPVQGGADPRATALSRQVNSSGGHSAWNNEQCVGKSGECMLISSMLLPDKKKSRNIGSKSKRLLIDSQEMLELKLCWEEVHDMLRPTQGSNPNVVTIEDYEIEEYEEPPVFGKWSIFAVRSSGLLEQWAQCDSCFKWRRFPVDALLPSKWTCTENIWEPSRSSCSAPDELSPRELENFVRLSKDYKKRKVSLSHKTVQEQESSGLDALANAATLRNDVCDPGASSVAATTKHPRHRAGCSCIVCIQPPSGKGKHKPSCTCNVCMTVKRRFKTLMLRKKKRQSEQEAEIALRNNLKQGHKDDAEGDSLLGHTRPRLGPPDNEVTMTDDLPANCHIQYLTSKEMDSSKSLDLNCQPDRQTELARLSMAGLLQLANQPLETYMKQSGLQTLTSDQQASSGSRALHHSAGETGGQLVEDRLTIDSELQKQENAGDENGSPDKGQHVTQ